MYILLIIVHALFAFIAHLFGYFIIEWVFLVLMIFFLLYFSPIFFFKNQHTETKTLFSLEFSPQKSLVIPLILTYLGIYILAFTFSATISDSIHAHMSILLVIFMGILWYMFTFSWKNEVFFNILWFHLFFSAFTLIVVSWLYFFYRNFINWIDVIFTIVTIIFSGVYFLYTQTFRQEFVYSFLLSLIAGMSIILLFFWPWISLNYYFGILGAISILPFEYAQKIDIFNKFIIPTKVFFLASTLFFGLGLIILLLFSFESVYFLMILTGFWFWVHSRFFNTVCYVSGVFSTLWMYGIAFFDFITIHSMFSTLLYIYFLPILLIVNTYFWQERQKYDFVILHYSSITFSILFFVYANITIVWWNDISVFMSLWIFLLAVLFFLSFFRFQKKSF